MKVNANNGCRSNWNRRLAITQEYWRDHFPDKSEYVFSVWQLWEDHVRNGHEEDKNRAIEKLMRMTSTSEPTKALSGDLLADELHVASVLSNNMYAAMIVSLWSSIEGCLKDLLYLCRKARGMNSCVCRFNVRQIRTSFSSHMNINLNELPEYLTVNAVRILSNCFKHSGGYYALHQRPTHEKIDTSVLRQWKCLRTVGEGQEKIEYTKLPIQKIVVASSCFVQELMRFIEKGLGESGHGV